MKFTSVLLATSCLLSAVTAQSLERTIHLPDTFELPHGQRSVAHNASLGVMYIAGDGSDSILVVDEYTCRPVEKIAVGCGVTAMASPHDRDVLFCALGDSDQVIVLDGETHSVTARYRVGDCPGALLSCDVEKKLYVANWGDTSVSVIDWYAGSVVARIPGVDVEWLDQGMCHVSSMRRVFCANQRDSTVVVVDASSDTVLARIKVGDLPSALCYNPANARVYCACWGDHRLYAIDAATNVVVSVIEDEFQTLSLACGPLRNRIYAPNGYELVVVDGSADTVMARIVIDTGLATLVSLDSQHDKVLVAREDDWGEECGVTVIDCESLTPRKYLAGPATPCAMGSWGLDGDVFCAGWDDEEVFVYDGEHDRVAGVLANSCYPIGLYAEPATGKLYCLSYGPSLVTVIDPVTNGLLASIPVADYPEAVCFNTVDRKVYVASAYDEPGTMTVVDGVGDTLLTEVDVDGTPTLLTYNPNDDVLYAADRGSYWIQAISGKADSVIDYFQVFEKPTGLIYNHEQRKLYSSGGDSTVTVIDPSTHGVNTRIRIGAGLGCFALNSDGSRLYCGSPNHDSVYVIDCVQDRVVGTIPVAGSSDTLCYNARDNRLYSASRSGSGALSVIDCVTNAMVATLPFWTYCASFDYGTDALYCVGGDGLSVVDCQTNVVTRSFEVGDSPSGVASAPRWSSVYVSGGEEPYLYAFTKPDGPAEMAVRAAPEAQATFARGSLYFAGKTQAAVFDRCGRLVANLHPGPNDVSRLSPGVYFVREAQAAQAVRKVIVAR